jgi:hypothetical protein
MRRMNPSYAVSWNDIDGMRCAGRLDLTDRAANLVGTARGTRCDQTIAFDEIGSVRVERGRLHVDRQGGGALWIGSLDGPGALREIADRLAAAVA